MLLSVGITAIPSGRAAAPANASLIQQRALLLQQLAAMQPAKDSAASALAQAETAFANLQAQLLAAQQQLSGLNARMLSLSSQVANDEKTIVQAKQQLGAITRQTYESTSTNTWVAAVLSASNFSQAMDRLTGTSHLAGQVSDLQTKLRDREQAINDAKAQIATDETSSSALEHQLGLQSSGLLVLVQQRNAAFKLASGPARAIAAQIANIDQQLAGNAPSGASCGNHFAYGQCTYYVASRRCVPWLGNADQWFYNAAPYGYPEGHTPVPGAIVVFWPGGNGASGIGHVAYVEAVGPAAGIPAGYFEQSEMNYAGWNRVSYRILPNNSSGIQGFIYAK